MVIKERKTNETDIKVSLELYGIGKANIDTGVPFFRPYARSNCASWFNGYND